jgi:hypothetical protein
MEPREQPANRPWWGARLARQEQPPARLEQPLAQLGPWVTLEQTERSERLANRPWLEMIPGPRARLVGQLVKWELQAQLEKMVPLEHGALPGQQVRLVQLETREPREPRVPKEPLGQPEPRAPRERLGQQERLVQKGRQGQSETLGQPVLEGREPQEQLEPWEHLERLVPLERRGLPVLWGQQEKWGPLEETVAWGRIEPSSCIAFQSTSWNRHVPQF